MQSETVSGWRRGQSGNPSGRPSHYPSLIRYNEDAGVHAVMQMAAEREGLSFSELQRIVNRAGIQALRLVDA